MHTQLATAWAEPEDSSSYATDALVDALASEERLLRELHGIMARQRDAVAGDDLEAINDSVYATHRVLLTLREARKRRHALNRHFGMAEEVGVRRLEELLGDRVTEALRTAFQALQEAARELSRDLEVNRRILREALASGEEYVRTLMGAPETRALYSLESAHVPDERRGGVLINRKA